MKVGAIVQEEAGVNHTAAKIIDSIAVRSSAHCAVCPVSFMLCLSGIFCSMHNKTESLSLIQHVAVKCLCHFALSL